MIYRVGRFEIDTARFQLAADGKAIPVEPQVFDLIVCLVEHRDRVLTREELFDTLWAGRIVSDTSLSNHIKSARKALGDDGQKQQVIQTIHGRGYRFVAEVEEVTPHDAPDEAPASGQPTDPGPDRRRLVIYAAVLVLLVAVGSQLLLPGPGEPIRSVAVMPLKNLSDDPEQQYFVEGMQDALITRLTRTTELRVISKTSTMRYVAGEKAVPDIARELNVDALIEGSVLRDEDRVRITAQLIHGQEDEQLWAGSYDRDLDDVLLLINEISSAIANEIEVAVKPQLPRESAAIRSVDIAVHEQILKARHYFDRFRFEESLRHYQRAVEMDRTFATAHAGVAASYSLMEIFNPDPASDRIPRARQAALQARALDEESADGFAVLGFIQLYFDWDWESAGSNLRRALELNPNYGPTRHAYADYLMIMGDLEESLKQVEIGLLYDPFSPMANSVVQYHRLFVHRYDEVIEVGRAAIAEDPNAAISLPSFREALWLVGLHDEAFELFRQFWGRDDELRQAIDSGYSQAGHTGAMLALADTLSGRVPEYKGYIALAQLYARAGEPESALAWLEQAYEYRQPQLLHVKAMPVFADLQSDPRFQDLLRRIGFPQSASLPAGE